LKILHVNFIDLPGRRFNGYDLMADLRGRGFEGKQVALEKCSRDPNVIPLLESPDDIEFQYRLGQVEARHSMSQLLYPWGRVLAALPEFEAADVVHYHQVHNKVLSLLDLPSLFSLKPSVWTFHDPWPFSGHCVYPMTCVGWLSGCSPCTSLDVLFPMKDDCADRMWAVKRRVFSEIDPDVVVASEFMLDMVRRSPITSHLKNVHLIPFGIDTGGYLPDDAKMSSREALGIPEDDFVVMFRSAVGDFKGLPYIIEALGSKAPLRPTTLLTVDQTGNVKSLADDYRILEFGWVHDPASYMRLLSACDVFLMPSTAESFGLMALEAMAAGLPVVSFEGTAVPLVTRAPESGLAVPMGDSIALRAALDMLAEDPGEAKRRGQLARRLAAEEYSHEVYLDRMADLYRFTYERAGRSPIAMGAWPGPAEPKTAGVKKEAMPAIELPEQCVPCEGFDYSTPEAHRALADVTSLVLEIKNEKSGPITRKIRLYERTLGLAVIPVLLRRGFIVLRRKLAESRLRRT
jgi:glycosyltransferase involved in cell wall biosynthesis